MTMETTGGSLEKIGRSGGSLLQSAIFQSEVEPFAASTTPRSSWGGSVRRERILRDLKILPPKDAFFFFSLHFPPKLKKKIVCPLLLSFTSSLPPTW